MNIGIIGASGYVGGELLRILISHRYVDIKLATSRTFKDKYIHRVHPNLRGMTNLKFSDPDPSKVAENCDLIFLATPHGVSSKMLPQYFESGLKIIDTSADFRLKEKAEYPKWYNWNHPSLDLLQESVYGLPELHREEIAKAKLVACPGCMAVGAILALAPIVKAGGIEKDRIVIDVKVGSSGAGAKPSLSSHHSEHFGVVRPYKPVGHRHIPEIEQELNALADEKVVVSMSAHAVNMVRGILATCHVFTEKRVKIVEIWKLYRDFYKEEPFIRFVRDRTGVFRYPDPKIVVGSNYCDLGFEVDDHVNRVVTMAAIDNLVKGAAGTAVQNMNIILGLDERTGLDSPGLHPV